MEPFLFFAGVVGTRDGKLKEGNWDVLRMAEIRKGLRTELTNSVVNKKELVRTVFEDDISGDEM